MIKKLLFWVVLVVVQGLYAQVITVTDEETGKPLDLVTFMSNEPKAFTTTNAQGQADHHKESDGGGVGFFAHAVVPRLEVHTAIRKL